MPIDNEASKIFNAFARFVQTRDTKEIYSYSRNQLEHTLLIFTTDKKHPAYHAIEQRIAILKEEESKTELSRNRIQDIIIGFISGVLITIVAALLLKLFGLND